MVVGLGTDLIETRRVQESIDRFGERFLERIFTAGEIAYCTRKKNAAESFAARFAAKEAVSKAFGTGIGAQLGWQDIEICKKESGEPFVVLHGKGKELFAARGAKQLLVSLSHTEHYAAATAVLEG